MIEPNESLGTALPAEMKRVREVLIPAHQSVGPPGTMTLMVMQYASTTAEKVLAEGDVVGMLRIYAKLKDFRP